MIFRNGAIKNLIDIYVFLGSRIEFEPSFVKCEDLYPSGRMSFKNFNPTVEVSTCKLQEVFKDSCSQFFCLLNHALVCLSIELFEL